MAPRDRKYNLFQQLFQLSSADELEKGTLPEMLYLFNELLDSL